MSVVSGAREADWTSIGTRDGWGDPYTFEAEARTLASILDEACAPEVDLLSLDVEGYEAAALRGLELDRWTPRFILVEIHNRDRDMPPVSDVLDAYYTVHDWLSEFDVLYVRRG